MDKKKLESRIARLEKVIAEDKSYPEFMAEQIEDISDRLVDIQAELDDMCQNAGDAGNKLSRVSATLDRAIGQLENIINSLM